MSSLPPSSRYLQQPTAAVGDSEREALAKRLSDAFANGRLDQEDYMSSLDVVYGAQQIGELVPVIERLPAAAVETPNMVETSTLPAGEVSRPRNALLPALLVTSGVLVLLVILAIVVVLFTPML